MGRALIVVDVQNDFCEGGALAVTGGAQVAAQISTYLRGPARDAYTAIVATRDYHIDPGAHFSEQPDYVDTWPPHCRAGSVGASFHPDLDIAEIQEVFSKGAYTAAYSGFEGTSPAGTQLAPWLSERGVTSVDVVGLATDHCVRATALDAQAAGFDTQVLLEMCAGVSPDTTGAAHTQLQAAGVQLNR